MSSDDRVRRQIQRPMLIVGAVMTLVYLCIGASLLFENRLSAQIPASFREMIAGMIIIYGIYRGWRVYADYNKTT